MIVNYISTSFNNGQTHYTINIPKFSSVIDINISNLYIPDNYKFFKTIIDLNIDSNVISSGRTVIKKII
jgi:hypothetical protein